MPRAEDERIVTADVPATVIPYGDQVVIPAGTPITVTHRLGGNFTVLWERGMARVSGQYAEMIGEPPAALKPAETAPVSEPPGEESLWEALRSVYDPEIPVNIVDLGLIYRLEVSQNLPPSPVLDNPEKIPLASPPAPSLNFRVEVDMTLTAPGCGMGPAIAQDAKYRLEQVPGVSEAIVQIVWDPPWSQELISEKGRMELGLV